MPEGPETYCSEDLGKELIEQTTVICRAMDILKHEDNLKKQAQPSPKDQKQDYKEEVDEASGSEYRPSQSESSTDEDDVASQTSTSSAKKPDEKTSSSKRPRKSEPSTSSVSPSPKKPRQSSDKKPSSPSAATATPEATSSSSRSHHKKKKCPVPKCSFYGNDLRRHLETHVRKNEIASEAVEKLLSIVRAGADTCGKSQARRGKQPVKGRQRKWCPVPGCNQVVLEIPRHLENPNLHGFPRDSKLHIRYLAMAKPYIGLQELDDPLTPPPPPIVEIIPRRDSSLVIAASTPVFPSMPEDTSSATTSAAATVSTSSAAVSPTASLGASTAPCAAPSKPPSATAALPSASTSAASPGASSAASSPAGSFSASHAASSKPPSSTAAVPSTSVSVTVATAGADTASEDDSEAESEHQSQQMEGTHSEEGEQHDATSVQYFTAAHPGTARHRWLVMFYDFMTRPTAGDKKRSIRLQHASQMRNLLEAIDPKGDNILCLLDDEGDVVWKRWVKPHLTNSTKKPGTIISYLTSYEKFLSFVTHERFNKKAPPVHPDYMARFATLQKDIKGWRSTVDSQTHHIKNKRMVDETEGLLTLQELAKIKASNAYQEAHKLLVKAGRGNDLSLKEFVHVRDFLLGKFSLDTGTRPGPLNNATLEEYFVGKVEGGCKVILVAKHKRA